MDKMRKFDVIQEVELMNGLKHYLIAKTTLVKEYKKKSDAEIRDIVIEGFMKTIKKWLSKKEKFIYFKDFTIKKDSIVYFGIHRINEIKVKEKEKKKKKYKKKWWRLWWK